MTYATLEFDGACSPNSGRSRCGFVLRLPEGRVIERSIDCQGTNITAEYFGLIHGMRAALEHGVTRLAVRGDSQLVINGVRSMRPWRKGKPHLEKLKAEAQVL